MSEREPFISVENLVKTFVDGDKEIAVLRGLTLSIGRGEVVAIVGESGAGKSTLLHLLGGLDTPTSGAVRFEGRDITAMDALELDRFRSQEVGFVFQFHHLMAEFTAQENVAIAAMIAGVPRPAAEERARELLTTVGLEERLTHRPPKLSGGERQRVALARALVNEPRVVLADEPTGNLDAEMAQQAIGLLRDACEEVGAAILLVGHDLAVLEAFEERRSLAELNRAIPVRGAL